MLSTLRPILSTSPLCFCSEWIDAVFAQYHRIWVGFSGGVDSHVLLHALVTQLNREQMRALGVIHVHHGLSEHADEWLAHCAAVCHGLGVCFVSKHVSVNDQASLENAARNARYCAFQQEMGEGDALLLAHHAGDQVETVLFRLLRGTGGKGLSGIPYQRALAKRDATLIRPLLQVDKASIEVYALQHGLQWISDESNKDERFTRNFLRQSVLPTLKQRFPQMMQSVGSTAQRVATDYTMLAMFADQQLDVWCCQNGSLPLRHIVDRPHDERLFWLRYFLSRWGVSLLHSQLISIDEMFLSTEDKQPTLVFSYGRLMRHQNELYVLPPDQPVLLGLLKSGDLLRRPFDTVLLQDCLCCELRQRPQGASLIMPNGHRRKLKKWLNDQQIPSWWREHLPYVFQGDVLVAIGDLWRHPDWHGQIEWSLDPSLPL
ncbi:tRNA lysidine(34) synthetase TilS [Marinomonas sp. IMCC 4694]|uniref:tRNA lysidine(34) synthetase TilS n=1 Tax=Marinomonas sp. IMCC 4694 TaxID=2605432 RepID=UPI0011E6FCF5|nr:tRNA lysidine(34) synthetase TilS [Marinomonas sp. IMCC 4694]TYL47251.1 tRNA lysidine(34) synthetase TilS [Marinomonas sp. IMCC 4694]